MRKGNHKTTSKMKSMGMCACSTCGKAQPLESVYCKKCKEYLFIVNEDFKPAKEIIKKAHV